MLLNMRTKIKDTKREVTLAKARTKAREAKKKTQQETQVEDEEQAAVQYIPHKDISRSSIVRQTQLHFAKQSNGVSSSHTSLVPYIPSTHSGTPFRYQRALSRMGWLG